MTFSNQKEETLNIELTSYGRYMLSLGKFKPSQYAFFDEDIIYDREYVASEAVELQNNIEGRIQEETPRVRPQSIYRAAEVGVFSEDPFHVNNLMPGVVSGPNKQASDFLLQTAESSYIYTQPLGNSAHNTNMAPAWDIGFYMAPLQSINYVWTGSADATSDGSTTVPTTFIPQLECDVEYEAHFYPKAPNGKDLNDYMLEASLADDRAMEEQWDGFNQIYELSDESSVVLIQDFAFLKVEEANVKFEKENFELEVYMVTSEANDKNPEVLERLYFTEEGDPTEKNVEYYFDLLFDFEIEKDEFCSYSREKEKIRNIYTDKIFDCNDGKPNNEKASFNIYNTSENQNIEDVCD
jgi:hypothetical protein